MESEISLFSIFQLFLQLCDIIILRVSCDERSNIGRLLFVPFISVLCLIDGLRPHFIRYQRAVFFSSLDEQLAYIKVRGVYLLVNDYFD